MIIRINFKSMKLENMPLSKEASNEKSKEEGEKEPLSSEEIKPGIVENIKREDVGNLEAAKKELADFAAQEKGGGGVEDEKKLLSLAGQKLDEMQAEIDKKKKGFINKMVFSEKDLHGAEAAIVNARNMVARGELPEMHTIKGIVAFAKNVDVSEFPERAGKKYSANMHTFGGGA